MKNFKGPRKHRLQLLFIGIVIIGAACLLIYTLCGNQPQSVVSCELVPAESMKASKMIHLETKHPSTKNKPIEVSQRKHCTSESTVFVYLGFFSRMEQSKPTRLSNLMSSNSTTLDAHPQPHTPLRSPVRSMLLLPNADNNYHGVKTAESDVNSHARNGFRPAFVFTSIPDMNMDRKVIRQAHYTSTHGQEQSNEPRKYGLDIKDPEADRVGPLYSFFSGGFIDPGELVIRKCKEQKPVVHMMVFSAPTHRNQRDAVRRSWANTRLDYGNVTVGFLVGRTQHPSDEQNLMGEQLIYGDLLRPDFVDEYRNLTLKTMFMLQWFNVFCDAHYLLKIDDDVALSADKLEGVLRKHANVSLGIIGRVNIRNTPIRDVRNKYYISHRQWPTSKRFLPPFTAGPSYLITRNATKLLYQRAMQTKSPIEFAPLEDVLFTGIIASAVNVQLFSEPYWLSEEHDTKKCLLRLLRQQEHILLSGKTSCITETHHVTYHPVTYRHMSMMIEALQPNCTKQNTL